MLCTFAWSRIQAPKWTNQAVSIGKILLAWIFSQCFLNN